MQNQHISKVECLKVTSELDKVQINYHTLMIVFGPVTSSKRIAYPTLSPSSVCISSLTLFATLIAATRLGWVQPTIPFTV